MEIPGIIVTRALSKHRARISSHSPRVRSPCTFIALNAPTWFASRVDTEHNRGLDKYATRRRHRISRLEISCLESPDDKRPALANSTRQDSRTLSRLRDVDRRDCRERVISGGSGVRFESARVERITEELSPCRAIASSHHRARNLVLYLCVNCSSFYFFFFTNRTGKNGEAA